VATIIHPREAQFFALALEGAERILPWFKWQIEKADQTTLTGKHTAIALVRVGFEFCSFLEGEPTLARITALPHALLIKDKQPSAQTRDPIPLSDLLMQTRATWIVAIKADLAITTL